MQKDDFPSKQNRHKNLDNIANSRSFWCFSQQQLAQLQKEKSEILKNLALYYFTFVDVMEFKVGKNKQPSTNTWD